MADQDHSQDGPKTVPLKMPKPTVPKKETVRINLKADTVAPTAPLSPPMPTQSPKVLRPEDTAAPIKTAPLTAAPKPPSALKTTGLTAAPSPLKTTVLTAAPKPPSPLQTGAKGSTPAPLKTAPLSGPAPTAPVLRAPVPTTSGLGSARPAAAPTVQLQTPKPAASPAGLVTQPLKTAAAPTAPGVLPQPTAPTGAPVPTGAPAPNVVVEEYIDEEAGNKNAGLPLAIGAFAISIVCLVAVCMNVSAWDGWNTLF